MEFGRESESNFVIDDLSRKYYQAFVQPWEATWKKGENPKVLTEKEIAEEAEEIRATTATVNMRVSNAIEELRQSKPQRSSQRSGVVQEEIISKNEQSVVYRSSKSSGLGK